jgi:hypothetical protein
MSRTPSVPVTPSSERQRPERQLAHERSQLDSLRDRVAKLQRLACTVKLLKLIQEEAEQLRSELSKVDRQCGHDIDLARTNNIVFPRDCPILKRAAMGHMHSRKARRTSTDSETAPSSFTYAVGSSGKRTQQVSQANTSSEATP